MKELRAARLKALDKKLIFM